MLIYRMEDRDGFGPFHGDSYFALVDAAKEIGLRPPPNPPNDGILSWNLDQICGCVSPRQFVSWFPRHVRQAIREEPEQFALTIWECPDERVQVGGHQCVFYRQDARMVAHRPI